MSLPNSTEVKTLNYSRFGQPILLIITKPNLEVAMYGTPFLPAPFPASGLGNFFDMWI